MEQIILKLMHKLLVLLLLCITQNVFCQRSSTEIAHARFHNSIIGGFQEIEGNFSVDECFPVSNGTVIIPFWFIASPTSFDLSELNITTYNDQGQMNGFDNKNDYNWINTLDLSSEFQENIENFNSNCKKETYQILTSVIQVSTTEYACLNDLESKEITISICFTKNSTSNNNIQELLSQTEIDDAFNVDCLDLIHTEMHRKAGLDDPDPITIEPCFDLTINICCSGTGPQLAPKFDMDGDGIDDFYDNCISEPNADQNDADGDGIGDACDDLENGGEPNLVTNNNQTNYADRVAMHSDGGNSFSPLAGQFGRSTILNKEYYIYNTDGRLVLKTTSKRNINLGNSPQLYIILEFINGQYTKTEKIILE